VAKEGRRGLPTRALTRLTGLVVVFAVLVPPLAGNFSGRVGQLITGYAIGITLVGAVYLLLRTRSTADERSESLV
jgi:alpha-1,6-mannosyltransferase